VSLSKLIKLFEWLAFKDEPIKGIRPKTFSSRLSVSSPKDNPFFPDFFGVVKKLTLKV